MLLTTYLSVCPVEHSHAVFILGKLILYLHLFRPLHVQVRFAYIFSDFLSPPNVQQKSHQVRIVAYEMPYTSWCVPRSRHVEDNNVYLHITFPTAGKGYKFGADAMVQVVLTLYIRGDEDGAKLHG